MSDWEAQVSAEWEARRRQAKQQREDARKRPEFDKTVTELKKMIQDAADSTLAAQLRTQGAGNSIYSTT